MRQTTNRFQAARDAIFASNPKLLLASVSMSGSVMTPLAVLGVVFGAWRLGADPGWTSGFFITRGVLSHYQAWFAIAAAAQACSFLLHRWVANRGVALPALAGSESSERVTV